MQQCYLCGFWFEWLETHELFWSSKRKECIKLKLQVKLCYECHKKVTRTVDSRKITEDIFKKLHLNFQEIHVIINRPKKNRTNEQNKYMQDVSNYMHDFHKKMKEREIWL